MGRLLSGSNLPNSILRIFRRRSVRDLTEVAYRRARERVFGVNPAVFERTIEYYRETKGERLTPEDALRRALDKERHKSAWFSVERKTLEAKMHFYSEVDVYPFRQPYLKRFGGFRWYRRLVAHIPNPTILEYGCGSAVLTEYLLERFPEARYVVADIPSVTLDFVKWKKARYGLPYEILTIGIGKEGIPLCERYHLIVCQDVLEHTPNPLEIVESFVQWLAPQGVLLLDFLNAPGGENLEEAVGQREAVKRTLAEKLVVLKAIDQGGSTTGLYFLPG